MDVNYNEIDEELHSHVYCSCKLLYIIQKLNFNIFTFSQVSMVMLPILMRIPVLVRPGWAFVSILFLALYTIANLILSPKSQES